MRRDIDLLCIGEAMVEFTRDSRGAWHESIAGDAFNTAVYARRLGCNAVFASAIGKDRFTDSFLAALRREKLDPEHVRIDKSRQSGVYFVSTDPSGERRFQYYRRESAASHWLDDAAAEKRLFKLAKRATVAHITGITLAMTKNRNALRRVLFDAQELGTVLSFDPNYRRSLWPAEMEYIFVATEFMNRAQILLPSEEDVHVLYRYGSKMYFTRRTKRDKSELVITRGDRPALVWNRFEQAELPTFRAKAIDTTAAGDAFNAGYLAARIKGVIPMLAARQGAAIASLVVRERGAIVKGATKKAVERLMAARKT
jgi:2-dehydro-3-deoxygluconokinase